MNACGGNPYDMRAYDANECGRTVRINKNTIILPIKKRNAKKTIQKTTLLRYLL